jgi:hypothetical protein
VAEIAGNGPAPAAVRRRRNEPARGEWVDLPPLTSRVLPALAPREVFDEEKNKFVKVPWSQRTRDAWDAWSNDPVTQMYSPADVIAALELALLFETMMGSKPNEVRLRMDGLGLTPKGKRDLRWRVQLSAASPLEAVPPTRGTTRKTANRRSRLTAVK